MKLSEFSTATITAVHLNWCHADPTTGVRRPPISEASCTFEDPATRSTTQAWATNVGGREGIRFQVIDGRDVANYFVAHSDMLAPACDIEVQEVTD